MKKWDVIRVYRPDIVPPHDKFCICVCPDLKWFFYFNSNPPPFRKARTVAVEVSNFEAGFLSHASYIDVSQIIDDVPTKELADALSDSSRCHGQLAPFLVAKIRQSVAEAASLTKTQKSVILT